MPPASPVMRFIQLQVQEKFLWLPAMEMPGIKMVKEAKHNSTDRTALLFHRVGFSMFPNSRLTGSGKLPGWKIECSCFLIHAKIAKSEVRRKIGYCFRIRCGNAKTGLLRVNILHLCMKSSYLPFELVFHARNAK